LEQTVPEWEEKEDAAFAVCRWVAGSADEVQPGYYNDADFLSRL